MKPLLIVMSAPSGTGKTTLCDLLLQEFPEITYSISCTTRAPRGMEEDGIDYFFLSKEAFQQRVAEGQLLEHAIVHGNYYGTPAEPVREAFKEGQSVLMDIDVVGADLVRRYIAGLPPGDPLRAGFTDIFIEPPSMETLQQRLEGRGEDDAATIQLRMKNAQAELDRADEFTYRVVNDELDLAYRRLRDIIMVKGGLL
ncbi:MAG: guanylate kinase [Kiritimatiellae bacterium]|nr:guanylate kinase [Kiritimatiellia bacterium]